MEQTRLICFYSGNHKAKVPSQLWKIDTDFVSKSLCTLTKLDEEGLKKWKWN